MQRILIVEDNKTLAKLISKKLKAAFEVEVDIAYRLSEAKLFLHKYKYFVTLLDINLPDAPNGEIVDYVLSKKQHVIILSGNIDKEFRKNILKKNIIDYVNKSGVDDINYIISAIDRLQKNRNHKVLVVDDSMIFRKQMSSFLENLFFDVYTVAHGEEALGMLQTHPDISLMITDYNMPVMDGLELTHEVRKSRNKNDLSIIAISSNSDEEVIALFLKEGANDYIKKPFSKEEFSCRINNTIESLENIQIITNHANRDFLTGLYNRRFFFKSMQEYMSSPEGEDAPFAVAMVDIDFFKKINDAFGHDIGDKAIVHLSDILRASTAHSDLVARFGGEEFCIVLKNLSKANALIALERIRKEVESSVIYDENHTAIEFTISIGASYHQEGTLDESISQADMMLYNAKHNGRNQVVME
jgi:diguanylate cyclase (GGDEF)-like protein